jgi:hypothetical protein
VPLSIASLDMPLTVVEDNLGLKLEDRTESFVIFYSSRDERGRLWCPVEWISRIAFLKTLTASTQDCAAVQDVVKDTFGSLESPSALLVYVGQRNECVTIDTFKL